MKTGEGIELSPIPFSKGDWIIDIKNPGQPGQYTGIYQKAGPHIMIQLCYHDGSTCFRPLVYLEKMLNQGLSSIEDKIIANHFGKVRDLQRLITFEKLKGKLHAIIYSMEAAQIDFYPYQFKPVLKFIDSPTERLIIADEVGLGKTIESALIWVELQARKQAQRLLVICPKILCDKWRNELRSKFLFDARIVDFKELRSEIEELKRIGPSHSFVLIATYTGLRPSKSELNLLKKDSPDSQYNCSPKTELLRELYYWDKDYVPFDLVIFDEAHYMRNPATTSFHLGECLAENAGSVLLVSATPVNNSNIDLHSLLRLADKDFFETQKLFEDLLEANKPAVQAINALSQIPIDKNMLNSAIEGMSRSNFIKNSPLFETFQKSVSELDINDKSQIARCQNIAEKLNLLGSYITRTRRVHVKEHRPLRKPVVLTVTYKPHELQLYNAIKSLVRARCKYDRRPFHIFQIMGLQLRAASCLPVIAEEIRMRRLGDSEFLLEEVFDDEIIENNYEEPFDEIKIDELGRLLDFDFESNDSKYEEFRKKIKELIPNEKVVVFAYYRPTLSYLKRRLEEDGIPVAVIHGGVSNDERWNEIERFSDPSGPKILLSSEVGSEGIDLQFCRIIVNYDMPWNPMRLEQRIGRIDRVGQKAKKLSIINFKIKNTIEEKVYDRLHAKLMLFSNSLGDIEPIIGKEVQNLSLQLLSQELTPEEENYLIEQSERVIEERLRQINDLEESGDTLIALSDYVQQKIAEDKEKGRYIQPRELEDYLSDFFEREFQGCEINYNTPFEDCIRIRLTAEAHNSLSDFIKNDKSIQARPFRSREFIITFKNDIIQRLSPGQKRMINFVNHLSPLIRWITKINRDRAHTFYNVSSIEIKHNTLPIGFYCYRIERWKFIGLSIKESLEYGVMSLKDKKIFSAEESEEIIQYLIHNGKDLYEINFDKEDLLESLVSLDSKLSERFSEAFNDFERENNTAYQIKVQRVTGFFNRKIEEHKQRIKTLTEANREPHLIRLAEGRLRTAENNKNNRLEELRIKKNTDIERSIIAAGIFRVVK